MRKTKKASGRVRRKIKSRKTMRSRSAKRSRKVKQTKKYIFFGGDGDDMDLETPEEADEIRSRVQAEIQSHGLGLPTTPDQALAWRTNFIATYEDVVTKYLETIFLYRSIVLRDEDGNLFDSAQDSTGFNAWSHYMLNDFFESEVTNHHIRYITNLDGTIDETKYQELLTFLGILMYYKTYFEHAINARIAQGNSFHNSDHFISTIADLNKVDTQINIYETPFAYFHQGIPTNEFLREMQTKFS